MILFSEIESGEVVAYVSHGTEDVDDALETMFPNSDGIQAHHVPIEVPYSLRGFKVEKKGNIVVKVHSEGVVVYTISPEELEKKESRARLESLKKRNKMLPVSGDLYIGKIFSNHVKRYSSDGVWDSIEDGSYFQSSDFTPVGWWGSFLDAGGYANMNREIVGRLHRHKIIPVVDIYPTHSQVCREVEDAIRDYSRLKPKMDRYPYVYAFTPMPHPPHMGKKIFFTMMETSTLHKDFARYCNMYSDEIWVPSRANKEIFCNYGVKKPVRVMPLGIDERIYVDTEPQEGRVDLSRCRRIFGPEPSDHVGSYRFITVISWNIRKGYDALVKSFFKTFTSSDDVCLVIATQYSTEEVSSSLKRYVSDSSSAPQVMHYHGVIPIDDMPHVYDACDCYIHMSRGEGFSLTQIEAAARGLPVISCYHSGMTEYMRDDNSYKIECNSDSPCSPELNSISCYYAGQRMWDVGEYQIDQASSYMRSVINNPDEASTRALRLQNLVKSEFTWDKCTKRVAEALKL